MLAIHANDILAIAGVLLVWVIYHRLHNRRRK